MGTILASRVDYSTNKIDIWLTHSLDKVFPKSKKPVGKNSELLLKVAGNETEDFQVVIRPKLKMTLHRVWATHSDLTCEEKVIDNSHVESHWIWYTWVQKNPPANKLPWWNLKQAPHFFPDGFLEEEEIRILPRWTQPLWVKVNIPQGVKPGVYRGQIEIHYEYDMPNKSPLHVRTKKTIASVTIPYSVQVWPFSLPQEATMHHTEWFFPDLLARYFRVEEWSEKHWKLIEDVAKDMAAHHQNMILTNFYNLVIIRKAQNGTISYDFSHLERWINLFISKGVKWIEGGHVGGRIGGWLSDMGFSRFSVVNDDGEKIDDFSVEKMDDEAFIPHLERFMKAVYAYIGEHWDLNFCVQHVADEPLKSNAKSWRKMAELVKSWVPPEVKLIDAAFSKAMGDIMDIRVPQIHHIKAAERQNPENFEQNLWSYVCLAPQGPHPNRFLDYASIRNRIIFWISYSLKLEGFLHWGYNWWNSWVSGPKSIDISPWLDVTAGSIYAHGRQRLPAGDPHIVYPGRKSICSSIRWEVIRKGFEDHKLLTLFEQTLKTQPDGSPLKLNGEKLLSAIRNQLARSSHHYTRNESKLLRIREQIGDTLADIIS